MTNLYTGDYYYTNAHDPDSGSARVYGGARTKLNSLGECKLALYEYLAKTRRWNHWSELPDNGFTFKSEKFIVKNGKAV